MSKNSDFLRDNAEGLKKVFGEDEYKIMVLQEKEKIERHPQAIPESAEITGETSDGHHNHINKLNEYHESIYANLIRENMQMKECYQETIIQYKEEIDDLIKTLKCHSDCIWFGKRHQKCSCCKRNLSMKDNYERR